MTSWILGVSFVYSLLCAVATITMFNELRKAKGSAGYWRLTATERGELAALRREEIERLQGVDRALSDTIAQRETEITNLIKDRSDLAARNEKISEELSEVKSLWNKDRSSLAALLSRTNNIGKDCALATMPANKNLLLGTVPRIPA